MKVHAVPNPALNRAPYGRWTRQSSALASRLALRQRAAQMDRTSLRIALQELGVPARLYSLSGSQADERICLYQDDGEWRVSFFERGQERPLGRFNNESAACEFMLEQLKHEL
jgi:hypothetical protein